MTEAERQAEIARQAAAAGLSPWQQEMINAVPTSVIQGIVSDNRPASSAVAPSSPQPRGSGWQTPRPLHLPPKHEIELIDRLAEKFAGPPNGPVR
jgi:hypothetical protein